MYSDKKRIYILTGILTLVLFLSFFIPVSFRRYSMAGALMILAILVIYLIKKRSILMLNKPQVIFLMTVIGVLYLIIYYLTGLNTGFYKNLYVIDDLRLLRYMIPIGVSIVCFEIIRRIILAQKLKWPNVLLFIAGVILDILIVVNFDKVKTFNNFMDIIAMALFPAITSNVLYTFISKNYGMIPNILYRLITILYLYIIPVIPKTPDVLVSFAKMIVPLLVLLFIRILYSKQKKVVSSKKRYASLAVTGVAVALMLGFVMLISCQFRYGMLVIATESMTGAINKGDAIIYERYEDQLIEIGDVIVFDSDGKNVVHRVVDIKRINNEFRYYTKGDANEDMDMGYITSDKIVGVTNIKIMYIGYPSLWMRSIFK